MVQGLLRMVQAYWDPVTWSSIREGAAVGSLRCRELHSLLLLQGMAQDDAIRCTVFESPGHRRGFIGLLYWAQKEGKY
jgi:hypothetical protein